MCDLHHRSRPPKRKYDHRTVVQRNLVQNYNKVIITSGGQGLCQEVWAGYSESRNVNRASGLPVNQDYESRRFSLLGGFSQFSNPSQGLRVGEERV